MVLAAIDFEDWPVMNDASSDSIKTIALATLREAAAIESRHQADLFAGVPVKVGSHAVSSDHAPQLDTASRLGYLERPTDCDAPRPCLLAHVDRKAPAAPSCP